jgi:DNA-binding winged helix-turn-helix (wHTH) protein
MQLSLFRLVVLTGNPNKGPCFLPADKPGGFGGKPFNVQTNWIFYPMNMTLVSPRGQMVSLSPKETRLIVYLLSRDPQPVMREEFVALIGGNIEQARRIDATIYRLRLKIKQITGLTAPISTLYGQGYKNTGIVVFGQLPHLK